MDPAPRPNPSSEPSDGDPGRAVAGSAPAASPPATPAYPAYQLLQVVAVTAVGLFLAWTLLRFAADLERDLYLGGVLGLATAAVAHTAGILVGAFLAPNLGLANASLASTVARFVALPLLAVSLYFPLLIRPQPLFIGAVVGYLVILVADSAVMMKVLRTPSRAGV